MKKITNHKQKNTRTVENVCKKGFNNNKVFVYKRRSEVGLEEYAFLRRTSELSAGWVSLIGGATYSPCLVYNTYKSALAVAAKIRNVYEFKNLQEFLDKKHLMDA